jgi:tetratricopeptide (TPR) repeat protein
MLTSTFGLIVCLILLFCIPAFAVGDPWIDFTNAGHTALNQSRYKEASVLFQHAIKVAEDEKDEGSSVGHSRLGDSVEALADVCMKQGKLADAEALYKRSLAIFEEKAKGLGKVFVQLHVVLNNATLDVARNVDKLGDVYFQQSKYAEAEEVYKHALRIWGTPMWRNSPEYVGRLVKLADLYQTEGKFAEADILYRQAIDTYTFLATNQFHSMYPGSVAKALDDYAAVLVRTNQRQQAAQMQSRAKAIRAKLQKEDL